jgi:uncharacterized membrane protein YuzA (DUF378 family)
LPAFGAAHAILGGGDGLQVNLEDAGQRDEPGEDIGEFGFDLVAAIFANGFGTLNALSRIVYILVGLSGIWLLFTLLPMVSATPNYRQSPSPSM